MRLRQVIHPLRSLVVAAALAPTLARAESVCPVGCDFATIREAVASVPVGGAGVFMVSGGVYAEMGTVDVQANHSVTLTTIGAVTLSNALDGPALSVEGVNARLTVVGMSVTAVNDRVLVVGPSGFAQVDDSVLYTIGLQDDGGAVSVNSGTLVAHDTLFLDNVATSAGGHLAAVSAVIDLTNCTFTGGFARRGGAILLQGSIGQPTNATITTGRFDDNLASELAGAIAVSGDVDLTVIGTAFEGNAAESGGVIADYGGPTGTPTVHFTGATLIDNRADATGGAVAAASGDWTFDGTRFSDNSAVLDGGALWIGGGSVTLTQDLLCQNTASNGGAVWTHTSVEQAWLNNRMIENFATGGGGAVDHSGAMLSMRQHNLLGNSASVGGAVRSESEILLRNSLIGWTDGAVAVTGPTVHADWNAFWANVAGDTQGDTAVDGAVGNDVFSDPAMERYQVGTGCDAVDDFYNWYGVLRDGGDPFAQADLDGSRADLGAYGGPKAPSLAWTGDIDGDGYPPLYDCIEGDPSVHPEAVDAPYDGFDADCDRGNDFDVDGDGYTVDVDCDDQDAAINPGARDRVGLPDQNCDGIVDVDGDGYPAAADCDDGDAQINPGAVEDLDPLVDRDCVPPADVIRPLEPRTCALSPVHAPPIAVLAIAVGMIRRKRRSHRTRSP